MCILFHLFMVLSVSLFTTCQTLLSVVLFSFTSQFWSYLLLFLSLSHLPITFHLTSTILSSSIYLFNVLYSHCFHSFHSSFLFAISVFCFLSFPTPPHCDPGCFSFLLFLLQFVLSFFTDVVFTGRIGSLVFPIPDVFLFFYVCLYVLILSSFIFENCTL